MLALFLIALAVSGAAADQRRRAKVTEGIVECRPSAFKGQFNWGTSELKEATIVEQATNATPNIIEYGGQSGYNFTVGHKYLIALKFTAMRHPIGFGVLPTFFGIKVTVNYTAADPGTAQIYEAIFKEKMIGNHECSPSLSGSGALNAEGCQWIQSTSKGQCPLDQTEDALTEMVFPFEVSNFPDVATTTYFRLIPTKTKVGSTGCPGIGAAGGTETLVDTDMICLKYNTVIIRA